MAEGARALIALADALENSKPPSPSQMVIDHARTTLLQGCESVARRKLELRTETQAIGSSLRTLSNPICRSAAALSVPQRRKPTCEQRR